MFKLKCRVPLGQPLNVFQFRTDDTPTIIAGLYNARLNIGGYWPDLELENAKEFRFDITGKFEPKSPVDHFLSKKKFLVH